MQLPITNSTQLKFIRNTVARRLKDTHENNGDKQSLVICSLWSYLVQFLRYGDLLAENCVFFLPLSHSAPPLHMFPFELRGEVNHAETTVTGLLCGESCMLPNLNRF